MEQIFERFHVLLHHGFLIHNRGISNGGFVENGIKIHIRRDIFKQIAGNYVAFKAD